MRTLILPFALLVFGLLAALPFRRAPQLAPADQNAEQRLADRQLGAANASTHGIPPAVTPLQETRSEEPGQQSPEALIFAHVATPQQVESPYEIPVAQLPASYHEVAVPLALGEEPKNLLRAQPVSQTTVRRTRYGIPLAAYAELTPNTSAKPDPASRWTTPQPVPINNHIIAAESLATNQQPNLTHTAAHAPVSEPNQTIQQAQPSQSQLAADLPTITAEREPAAADQAVPQANFQAVSQAQPPRKQTRQRHFIREPS
ncbi:hypothetical protein SH139x_003740 [Planctomycetaceae bacterium SH139]